MDKNEKEVEEKSLATDDKGGEGEAKADETDNFDYKEELDKVKSQNDKKDYAWEKTKKELKEAKDRIRELEGDGGDSQDKVAKVLEEKFESLRNELRGDKLGEGISKLTDNPYAQELVKIKLEQYPGMSTEEAWILVNKGKFEKQLSEVKKAKDSDTRKGNGSGSGQKDQDTKEPQLSPDDMKVIQRMGLKWDGAKFTKEGGRFALQIVNGKLEQISIPKKSK